MKKLLTILVLALALCLLCGAALAEEYAGVFTLYKANGANEFGPLPAAHTFTLSSGETVPLTGIVYSPTEEELKADKANHTEFVTVSVNGLRYGAVYPEFYILVQYNKDHDWKADNTDSRNVAATCSAGGKQVYKCSICGKTKVEDTDKATHTYEKVDTSTCKKEGVIKYQCSKCGEFKQAGGKDVEEKVIGYNAANYHKYGMVIEAPSCKEKSETVYAGSVYFKCSVCNDVLKTWAAAQNTACSNAFGYVKTPDAQGKAPVSIGDYQWYTDNFAFDGHTWSAWYDEEAANCYHGQQHKHRCAVCGKTQAVPVEDGEKKWDPEYVLDPAVTCKSTSASFICKNCNSKAPGHAAMAATKTTQTVNSLKEAKIIWTAGTLEATIFHTWTDTKVRYAMTAGGETWKSTSKITNTAWCTSGYTNTWKKCSLCGKYDDGSNYEAVQNTATNPGHTWSDWKKVEDNSPVAKWTRSCPICKKLETTTVNPGEPPCEEHTWVPDEGQTIKCGKNANIKQTCSVCGAKRTAEWEREHSWKQIGVVKEATCTEKGVGIAICVYEGCDAVDYPEIEATGHKPVAVAEVPATCKDAGTKAGYKCENCGKFLDSDKADAKVIDALETIPVDDKAHVKGELQAEVKATCTAEGKKIYTCTVCGKTITEKVEKLPHTYGEWVVTKPATKDADGEETRTCTVCKEAKETRPVKYVVTKPAEYKLTASYDGATVTGKLAHVDDTLEADVKNIRVTFYIEGNFYMATMAEVAADGTFSVDGVGPIVYITVAATGNTSVNPEDYQKIAEPVEIIVK